MTRSPEEPGMTNGPEEHAARFDEKAAEYDEEASPEYRECVSLVVAHARAALRPGDSVLDLGTGTGAVAFRLVDAVRDDRGTVERGDGGRVVGRDPSEGMLGEAERKAAERGLASVDFGTGRFRAPSYDGPADVVTSNFAMHHLDDDGKREAIDVVADYGPRRFVLGDVMLFGEADPDEPFYDPSVDDPATVGVLVDALTDAGLVVTAVERVHEQAGVLVADRPDAVVELWADARRSRPGGGDRGGDRDGGDA